jgi:hypothetical protein
MYGGTTQQQPLATVTQSKPSIPAADGLETIHFRLAYRIAENVGIGKCFEKEYGIESNWIDEGEEIPVDSGEFLYWLSGNVKG